MNFFENTRKPQGFGGKLMTKMMNIGHAKLSQWGFSNISVNPDAAVLDVGCGGGANIVAWLGKCGNGHVTGMDYSEVSVAESQKLNATAIKQGKCCVVQVMYLLSLFLMRFLIMFLLSRQFTSGLDWKNVFLR